MSDHIGTDHGDDRWQRKCCADVGPDKAQVRWRAAYIPDSDDDGPGCLFEVSKTATWGPLGWSQFDAQSRRR